MKQFSQTSSITNCAIIRFQTITVSKINLLHAKHHNWFKNMLPVLQYLQISSLPDKITLKQLFINFMVT